MEEFIPMKAPLSCGSGTEVINADDDIILDEIPTNKTVFTRITTHIGDTGRFV
jgi:hypothetical protein